MSNDFGFTKDHFDKYRNTKKKIPNSKLRSPDEPLDLDEFKKLIEELQEKQEEWGMHTARPRGTDKAKVIPVIVTTAICGRGDKNDRCRIVMQYWSLDGRLLATDDPCDEKINQRDKKINQND